MITMYFSTTDEYLLISTLNITDTPMIYQKFQLQPIQSLTPAIIVYYCSVTTPTLKYH